MYTTSVQIQNSVWYENSSPSFATNLSHWEFGARQSTSSSFSLQNLFKQATLTARPIVGEDRKEGVKLAAEVTRPQLRRSLERALFPSRPASPSPQNKSPLSSPPLPTLSGKGRRNHFKTLPPGETERERSRVGEKVAVVVQGEVSDVDVLEWEALRRWEYCFGREVATEKWSFEVR